MRKADRLHTVREYYFSRKLREIDEMRARGHDVLNLAIGNPDLPPHPEVIATLQEAAARTDVHGYQSYQGLPRLREAIAGFYQRKYGVVLDPHREILPLMGSKEGIMHISMAYLNPGDQVVVPELAYPTYEAVARLAGAAVIQFGLDPESDWEPDWSSFDGLDPAVRIIWINYPHMPTGSPARQDKLEKFVHIAREHDCLLVHDNPYSLILNEDPRSIFEIPGAKEVALELNSLSKTYNMAGWRVGWVCGSEELVAPVLQVRSNMDSGMFLPVQLAAAKALSLGDDWHDQVNECYIARRQVVFELLDCLGFQYDPTQQGLFVWARVPGGGAEQWVDRFLYDHQVFLAPGGIFGPSGKDYVRVSLCNPEEVYSQAIKRIRK